MRAVHLHIDRIVVEGLPEARQLQFAGALEKQLRAWAASQAAEGIASHGQPIPTLDAGLLKPDATARQAAMQVVNSIARRVGGGEPKSQSQGSAHSRAGEVRGHV
ncbi:MAG TPA: hypothetical protein VMA34_18875 [Terracidiphilus sp.]|nr:hypothetical protein [Terracidiphilus sp.]